MTSNIEATPPSYMKIAWSSHLYTVYTCIGKSCTILLRVTNFYYLYIIIERVLISGSHVKSQMKYQRNSTFAMFFTLLETLKIFTRPEFLTNHQCLNLNWRNNSSTLKNMYLHVKSHNIPTKNKVKCLPGYSISSSICKSWLQDTYSVTKKKLDNQQQTL